MRATAGFAARAAPRRSAAPRAARGADRPRSFARTAAVGRALAIPDFRVALLARTLTREGTSSGQSACEGVLMADEQREGENCGLYFTALSLT